jgi:hypothetical protein
MNFSELKTASFARSKLSVGVCARVVFSSRESSAEIDVAFLLGVATTTQDPFGT